VIEDDIHATAKNNLSDEWNTTTALAPKGSPVGASPAPDHRQAATDPSLLSAPLACSMERPHTSP